MDATIKDKALDALEAVQPVFYGMLLKQWGSPNDWPDDRHGTKVYEQMMDVLRKAGRR